MRILVLSSLCESLVNFRGHLLSAMVREGHEVVACAPDRDPEVEKHLTSLGIRFEQTPMARAGSNPAADITTLAIYIRLILRERPGLVLAYTQKPIIYGGIATRLTGGARFFALVSGLGYVFSAAADRRPTLRKVVQRLYRVGLRRAQTVFVFNGDDRAEMVRSKIISKTQRVVQVPGSGVDIRHFNHCDLPEGPPVFLMVSRLLHDKGIAEYVEAARRIRKSCPEARFQLLGRLDGENPTSLSMAEVERLKDDPDVELLPETRDVRPFLSASTVFVLPSYYREGLPRSILEAMATGRAVVTTDLPGCRDPIVPGKNGLLIAPRSVDSLVAALTRFVESPKSASRMGREARRIAEESYAVELVNRILLSEMRLTSRYFAIDPTRAQNAGFPKARST